MSKINQISKEGLEAVTNARTTVMELTATAEKAVQEAQMAKLKFQLALQQLFISNKLDEQCKVDMFTGAVTWPEPEVVDQITQPEQKVVEPVAVDPVVKQVKKSKKVK